MSVEKEEAIFYKTTEIYQIYSFYHSNHFSPSESLPELNSIEQILPQEREIFKIFLFHETYRFLLNTLDVDKEGNQMFDQRLIRQLLLELIAAGESLEGIHYASHIPLDILYDIALGVNSNPSIGVSSIIIQYYVVVKRTAYTDFLRKIFQLIAFAGKI